MRRIICLWVLLLPLAAAVGPARDLYVTPPGGYGTNNPPFTNWADAATNLFSAVAAATNGDTIWVTNGTYHLTNTVVITNAITLQGFNGWSNTFINGGYPAYTNRCFTISNSQALVDGFTISNGFAPGTASPTNYGAGVFLWGGTLAHCYVFSNMTASGGGGGIALANNAMVYACMIVGNFAAYGGGFFIYTTGGTVSNCTIVGNNNSWTGGGGYGDLNSKITYCRFYSNRSLRDGGGVYLPASNTIEYCEVISNVASYSGGGMGGAIAMNAEGGTVRNCLIANNSSGAGPGGVLLRKNSVIENCLFYGNTGTAGGGIYILDANQTNVIVRNCCIVSNRASGYSGGIFLGGNHASNYYINCIVYSNKGASGSAYQNMNFVDYPLASNSFYFTCVETFAGVASTRVNPNQGNIMDTLPGFFNWYTNFRLINGSPCVDAGSNQPWMDGAVDLDGHNRINWFSRHVDMGPYELIPRGMMFMSR